MDLEILRWLQLHRVEFGVEAWVVLDSSDILSFSDTQAQLLGHVVRTDPHRGLADADVELALQLLETQSPGTASRHNMGSAPSSAPGSIVGADLGAGVDMVSRD